MNTGPTSNQGGDPLPPIYWYTSSKLFFYENADGTWSGHTESSVKRFLKTLGYDPKPGRGELISPLDTCLYEIERQHPVSYCGIIPGYAPGYYDMDGAHVIVTEGPKFLEAVEGDWTLFEKFLQGLLGWDPQQLMYFHAWMKLSAENLRAGRYRPSQALIMCGPAGCGKSYLQNLISIMLGGEARVGKPYEFMIGKTPFNGDLFRGESLIIEDETFSRDGRARASLASQIKNLLVNETQRCHPKGVAAVILRPRWRLTMSVNDTFEDLMVMPLINESNEDKMIIFKAGIAPMPPATTTAEEWAAHGKAMRACLPGYLFWLFNKFQIPTMISDNRYGVKAWHHPDILKALDDMSPQLRLLSYIDLVLFGTPGCGPWGLINGEGLSEDLHHLLTSSQEYGHQCRELLHFPGACGSFLGHLSRKFPKRVSSRCLHGRNRWTIYPP